MDLPKASLDHVHPGSYLCGPFYRYNLTIAAGVFLNTRYSLLIDVFLVGFIVPILPHMLEERIGLDPPLTQTLTSSLLVETAFVEIIASPLIGHVTGKNSA